VHPQGGKRTSSLAVISIAPDYRRPFRRDIFPAVQAEDRPMKPQVFVISDSSDIAGRLGPALFCCGMALRTAASAYDVLTGADAGPALCVVVDLPGREGLHALETLRRAGVMAPAIVIAAADDVLPPGRLRDSGALDVLERPADKHALLCWLECICTAHLAIARRRAALRAAA